MLQSLFEHGHRWDEITMMAALTARKVENVRFLVEAGCDISFIACTMAAMMGDLDCLTFLRESGGELIEASAVAAAAGGHLNCLTYLHQQGCPWDESCCEKAAFGGHLDCLNYLHEHGCPWDYTTTSAAVAGGSWKCLWYALRHGANCIYLILVVGSLFALLLFICIAIGRDRKQNVCKSSFAYDALLMLGPICNLNTALCATLQDHYTVYVSDKARKRYMLCFLATVVAYLVYCIYSIYTCTEEAL